MPFVHASASMSSAPAISSFSSEPEGPDIWFDAIDYVEMDKHWFDAGQSTGAHASSQANTAADQTEELIPFTEDCRRCVKELIRHLGDVKESELVFAGLLQIFPRLPAEILLTAHSLYVAVIEKKNIDIAVLSTLGLASSCLLDNGNAIASVAHYLRSTLLDYVDQSDWGHYLRQDDHSPTLSLFSAMAVLAIVARHWISDECAPQRRWLRAPAFLANLLLRANSYTRPRFCNALTMSTVWSCYRCPQRNCAHGDYTPTRHLSCGNIRPWLWGWHNFIK